MLLPVPSEIKFTMIRMTLVTIMTILRMVAGDKELSSQFASRGIMARNIDIIEHEFRDSCILRFNRFLITTVMTVPKREKDWCLVLSYIKDSHRSYLENHLLVIG